MDLYQRWVTTDHALYAMVACTLTSIAFYIYYIRRPWRRSPVPSILMLAAAAAFATVAVVAVLCSEQNKGRCYNLIRVVN